MRSISFLICKILVSRFGSATVNFESGKFHVTSYQKDYKAHGALMIIAWIVFVPLGKSQDLYAL